MDIKGKGRAIDVDELDDEVLDSYATTSSERSYLAGLNEAQREAVTWTSVGGLQILAGPGSGKHAIHNFTLTAIRRLLW